MTCYLCHQTIPRKAHKFYTFRRTQANQPVKVWWCWLCTDTRSEEVNTIIDKHDKQADQFRITRKEGVLLTEPNTSVSRK